MFPFLSLTPFYPSIDSKGIFKIFVELFMCFLFYLFFINVHLQYISTNATKCLLKCLHWGLINERDIVPLFGQSSLSIQVRQIKPAKEKGASISRAEK